MDCFDENGKLDDGNQLTPSPDCVSPSKSRYGRTRRPKIVQDFYNLDHVVIDEKYNNFDGFTQVKKSPSKQLYKNKDEIIDTIDINDKTNQFDLKEIVDGQLMETTPDNGDNVENDVTKVLKLITKPTIVDNCEKTNKIGLKTYTNKRKHFDNQSVIESFGLPDEPIIPLTSPVNKNHDDLKLNLELSNLFNDDLNCRRNTRSSSKVAQDPLEISLDDKKTIENCVKLVENGIIDGHVNVSPVKSDKSKAKSPQRVSPRNLTDNKSMDDNLEIVAIPPLESSQNTNVLEMNTAIDVKHDFILNNNNNNYNDKKLIEYKVGDLLWAKMGSHPYWPCLITLDPKLEMFKRYLFRSKAPHYHVRFFADNGRRSWVHVKNLLQYFGKDDLDKIHQTLLSQDKSDPHINDFIIKSKKLPIWTVAVDEAELLLNKTIEERLQFFDDVLLKNQIKKRDSINLNRKHQRNSDTINIESKRFKRNSRNSINSITSITSNNSNNSTNDENTIEKISIEKNIDRKSIPSTIEEQETLYRRNNIFRGISREKVCQICEKFDNVQKCKGPCNGFYHENCLIKIDNEITQLKQMSLSEKIDYKMKEIMKKSDNSSIKHVTANNVNSVTSTITTSNEEFRCHFCRFNKLPPCLGCLSSDNLNDKLPQKCSLYNCGQFYHLDCLKLWPQTQWTSVYSKIDSFICPRHICHTCCSNDPETANSRCSNGKLVKCLRCPATYHTANYCVPAGTLILSTTQIICPRHFVDNHSDKNRNNNHNNNRKRNKYNVTVNANWCFICLKGGNLVCCETCPTTVHIECLPTTNYNNNDTFFCEDCQSGRLPLYDEIVWVKLGKFRWWPAVILFPNEIPDNIKHMHHNQGEFVVKYFGTYDHSWVGRGRTFLFQDGDNKGHTIATKKRFDTAFYRAVEEAIIAYNLKKEFKLNIMAEKNSALKPPHYIRIKSNKRVGNVRQFDGNTSNTTSCNCDPNQEFPCGPDSDCLNRLLLSECNPDMCPAGERCNNQCFEKREYPPLIPYKTEARGWGLKTLAPIRKGQFVIEYVGEMIDEQEYQRRIKKMHEQKDENFYFLTIDNYRMLDAGPKGNVARFMNHSCQPNCETQKWTVNGDTRVGLFANCDIPAGTELTFNYNLECIGEEKKVCKCGAPNCSGFIGVKAKTDEPVEPKKVQRKKRSKKKKVIKSKIEPIEENLCFICKKTGEVYACNNKICTKFYHLNCVGLESWTDGGKWTCSWHSCNICSKRTIRSCFDCINSYCPSHSDGNIRYDKFLGFVCKQHDPVINNCKESEIFLISEAKVDETEAVSKLENNSVHLVESSDKINQDKKQAKKQKRSENEQTQRLTRSNSGFLLQDIDQTMPIRKRSRLRCET